MNKSELASNADRIEAYKEFGDYERHFNQMQSVCRGFASTWLLATFGAIGYALWNKEFSVSNSVSVVGARTTAASLVALAGGTGIFLLWLIDIVVYHRLLVAVTSEASELEAKMGDFNLRTKFKKAANAPVRVLGFELFKNEGARKIIATFYWLPSLFLLAIATVLHLNDWSLEPTVVKVGVTLWHVLLSICVLVMIFNKNPGSNGWPD